MHVLTQEPHEAEHRAYIRWGPEPSPHRCCPCLHLQGDNVCSFCNESMCDKRKYIEIPEKPERDASVACDMFQSYYAQFFLKVVNASKGLNLKIGLASDLLRFKLVRHSLQLLFQIPVCT